MALINPPDRVLETSTTTGTGTYTLAGAVPGFRAASTVCINTDTAYYYAEEVGANGVPTGGYETGIGTWGTGNTLARTTIHTSSMPGAPTTAMNWSTGTRRISLSLTSMALNNLYLRKDILRPAFSAYLSANQTITTATYTKVQCDLEEYDKTSSYDRTTNHRFQPTTAGVYSLSGRIDLSASTSPTRGIIGLYLNGVEVKRGDDTASAATGNAGLNVFAQIVLNGTTDYVELWAYITATTAVVTGAAAQTYFQGFLIQ